MTAGVLIIDNYDSYTYNLYQLIASVTNLRVDVVRNDDPALADAGFHDYLAAVISPGPGTPRHARDVGHGLTALRRHGLPVLGVCLGHQAIGWSAGAQVVPAPEPRHGHLSRITHSGRGLFAAIPQGFGAVRYHSLCLREPLPGDLAVTARAEDGVVMAVEHRRRPWWGVQFHPESIESEYGAALVANFVALAADAVRRERRVTGGGAGGQPVPQVRQMATEVDTAAAYARLYRDAEAAFWLDSGSTAGGARWSFLGDATGPHAEVLTYRVGDRAVAVRTASGEHRSEPGDIFALLSGRLAQTAPVAGAAGLPFDLAGGYVGYFGYELKSECDGGPNRHRSETPDAVWVRADRLIAVDHQEQRTYLVALATDATAHRAAAWLDETEEALATMVSGDAASLEPDDTCEVEPWLTRSRERYLADIDACLEQLRRGESYEICLTNRLVLAAPPDDLDFYLRLRRANPAPYGALLRLGEVTVFSSSPERFLRVDRDRVAESKPIKGTAPRDPDPAVDEQRRHVLRTDAKTRAENLMIVDLLRNDLGRVCRVGSVQVPSFMATETYATVHQLVSTVRGTLADGVTAVDCARACFPAGSMTGAPKRRTMEIIDQLETGPRGIYSGTLGYFGPGGSADLSVVIRTVVRWRDRITVGAGGAIVLASDPVAEYDEMALKARATLRALPTPAAAGASAGGVGPEGETSC